MYDFLRKRHCVRGHEYTPANTYVMKSGHRQCKTCKRALNRRDRDLSVNPPLRRKVQFNGRTQTITEWARELGINRTTLFFRFNNGWSIERALTTPPPDAGQEEG
ncbi:hypothetical protein [Croceibacterium ferulae]|uniref:hypothetical protein n=1 Tax=Croceibacterium ferulae TaxID=1854641 RepID=UPI000F861624|nr:hypothetical protein [Croceibacterium ferulae]